jgi:hypothetical protein
MSNNGGYGLRSKAQVELLRDIAAATTRSREAELANWGRAHSGWVCTTEPIFGIVQFTGLVRLTAACACPGSDEGEANDHQPECVAR